MVRLGYKALVANKCVFIHIDTNGHLIIVAVYIDDFLFISKSQYIEEILECYGMANS